MRNRISLVDNFKRTPVVTLLYCIQICSSYMGCFSSRHVFYHPVCLFLVNLQLVNPLAWRCSQGSDQQQPEGSGAFSSALGSSWKNAEGRYSFCPGLVMILILHQRAQKNTKCMHNGVCSLWLWKGLHLKHDYKAYCHLFS